MRATWKGSISFGLVSVPVGLYPATREHNVPLHQVHAPDGARVRIRRICEEEQTEVPNAEIAKGYEAPDGQTVILSDKDLAELPVASRKIIDVLAFVDADRIDPLSYGKPYYVGPERAGNKAYVLLRDTMKESGQVAVTKITLATRESLAVLRAHPDGELLVLQTVLWPDEVTTPVDIAPPRNVTSRPQELKMARSLMDTLSEDFDLADLHDDYQTALAQLVQARLEGGPAPHGAKGEEAGGTVIDLMAALERSVDEAKSTRGDGDRAAPRKRAARTSAAAKGRTSDEAPAGARAKKTAAPARRRTS